MELKKLVDDKTGEFSGSAKLVLRANRLKSDGVGMIRKHLHSLGKKTFIKIRREKYFCKRKKNHKWKLKITSRRVKSWEKMQ